MKAAIATLEIHLAACEDNEPVHKANGDTATEGLCKARAADYRQALAILRAASGGPIWEKSKAD